MATPDSREQWHFRKEVNLAHIITTLAAILSVGVFLANQDKRVTLLERTAEMQARIDAAQDVAMKEFKGEIKNDLREIKEDVKAIRAGNGRR